MNLKFRKKPVVIEAFQMTEERFAKVFSAVLGVVWTNILQQAGYKTEAEVERVVNELIRFEG